MVRSLREIRINVQIMVPDTRDVYLFKEVELKRVAKKINVRYMGSVLLWALENLVAVSTSYLYEQFSLDRFHCSIQRKFVI
jgi:hypothetical protein